MGEASKMENTIYRQTAIDAVLLFMVEYCGAAFDEDMQTKMKQRLEELPPVQSERKTGKWIYEVQDVLDDETDDGPVYRKEKRWRCSECGYDKGFALYKPKDKFCIECGAKMETQE